MIEALAASLLAIAAASPEAAPVADVYKTHCQSCHMADGDSPLEPMNFADGNWKHGSAQAKVEKIIADGAPGTAMLPFKAKLTPAEIKSLAAYVRAFDKKLTGSKAVKKK
jgi:mono/diheme cytochrome c family protein